MKNKKILVGILAIVVISAALYGSPRLFQGKFTVSDLMPDTCSHEWTRVLSGSYRYDPPPNTGTDRVDLAGVAASQVRDLARMIRSGCDMKVQFLSNPENAEFGSTVTCETIDLNGAPEEDLYIDCKFYTPFRTGSHHEPHYLYDSVAFWLQGGNPKLSKSRNWIANTSVNGDYTRVVASFFGFTAWDIRQDWDVHVYTKK